MEEQEFTLPQFTYLSLVPGDLKDRSRCYKAMRKFTESNFYYCNSNFPVNIMKFQPIVKGENYVVEMMIVLNREAMTV